MRDQNLIGHIDACVVRPGIGSGISLEISGWVIHASCRITDISIGLDSESLVKAERVQRPDVMNELRMSRALSSGFLASITSPSSWISCSPRLICSVVTEDGLVLTTHLPVPPEVVRAEARKSCLVERSGCESVCEAQSRFNCSVQQALSMSDCKLQVQPAYPALVDIVWILKGDVRSGPASLLSLIENVGCGFNLTILDSLCNEESRAFLSRVKGAQTVSLEVNTDSGLVLNNLLKNCKSDFFLITTSDVEVLPCAVETALTTLQTTTGVGALNGRILASDLGSYRPAGFWISENGELISDFSAEDGMRPGERLIEVDLPSRDFFAAEKEVLLQLGGWDTRYQTEIYQDLDLSLRLRMIREKVCYHADIQVVARPDAAWRKPPVSGDLKSDRELFLKRFPDSAETLSVSRLNDDGLNILLIDDFLPADERGQGLPRTGLILQEMVDMGHSVTLLVMDERPEFQRDLPALPIPSVSCLFVQDIGSMEVFMRKAAADFDMIWISRPHNINRFRQHAHLLTHRLSRPSIVYDAEAVFEHREVLQSAVLQGVLPEPAKIEEKIRGEIQESDIADLVVTVSGKEKLDFEKYGSSKVLTLGFTERCAPAFLSNDVKFMEREGALFVGPVIGSGTSNADSLRWFINNVRPLLGSFRGMNLSFLTHVGYVEPGCRDGFEDSFLRQPGPVKDLAPLFEKHRIFVAPVRFSAGIPLKVIQAASFGLPVVATSLVGEQLGWTDGEELLIADKPEDFAAACLRLYSDENLWRRIREGAFARIRKEYSPEQFRRQLDAVFNEFS